MEQVSGANQEPRASGDGHSDERLASILMLKRRVAKSFAIIGTSLVKAMELASRCADPQAAQIVAAECVVLAETKDHLNWELIGELAKNANADESALLTPAYEQVEDEEDEHLYHTAGWTRELWIEALGMPAVLPPPEEVKKVDTAIEAAQAKKSRTANAKAKKASCKS